MFESKENLIDWLKAKGLYKGDVVVQEHLNIDKLIESFVLYYDNGLSLVFYYDSVYNYDYRLCL